MRFKYAFLFFLILSGCAFDGKPVVEDKKKNKSLVIVDDALQLNNIPFVDSLDNIYTDPHKRLISISDQIMVGYLNKSVDWYYTFIGNSHVLLNAINTTYPQSDSLTLISNDSFYIENIKLNTFSYYLPYDSTFKKSWIWQMDGCDYLLWIKINSVLEKDSKKQSENITMSLNPEKLAVYHCGADPMDRMRTVFNYLDFY